MQKSKIKTYREKIVETLENAMKEITSEKVNVEVFQPTSELHGDYSTNISLVLGKKLGKNPMEVAEELTSSVQHLGFSFIEKVEVAKPGFINFWLSYDVLSNNLQRILSQEVVIKKFEKPRLEMIENTQPNTNKPLHIGHLRNTALGVSLVNLRKSIGHNTLSVNINNDRGIHIVKAMWAFIAFGKKSLEGVESSKLIFPKDWKELLKEWSSSTSAKDDPWQNPKKAKMKPDHFVGKFYVLGERAEKEIGEKVSLQLQEMLKAWEDEDGEVLALWTQMNEWFYEGFRLTHGRFLGIDSEDVQFDKEWYESDIYKAGKQIVLDNLNKGLFYEREDKVILANLKKYGLPDKVIIRSDGTSVYITQDLELARVRLQEDKAGFVGYVVGDEQELHFKQLFAICEELGFGRRENYMHISYGMVNLSGGVKMSSREGTVVTADQLMDQVVNKVKSAFDQKDKKTVEKIAVGAIKYWMLKYNPKAKIEFDVNESVSLEGNSGPYLQYSYVRTVSVLQKSKTLNPKFKTNTKYTLNEEESALLRSLIHYQDSVWDAAYKFSLNLLANYLFDLAQKYNLFYQKHKIIGSENEEFRLSLTQAVGTILKSGLELLGIQVVEKM